MKFKDETDRGQISRLSPSTAIVMLILASGCGFLGGVVSTRLATVSAQSTDVVRTSRVEVIDSAGKPRAVLATEDTLSRPRVTLSFFDPDGKAVASLGLEPNLPFIKFTGPDGNDRMSFGLTGEYRAVLEMSDERPGRRLILGAFEPHEIADRDHAAWGLELRSGVEEPGMITWIGMNQRSATEPYSGSLTINHARGSFRIPQD
jgi:hypothetical protein